MTFARKTLLLLLLILAVCSAFYEVKTVIRQRSELQQLQKNSSQLATEIERTRGTLADIHHKIASVQADGEESSSLSSVSPTSDPEAANILARTKRIKRFIEENPREKIPELELLTNLEWLDEILRDSYIKLDDEGLSREAVHLRLRAKQKFSLLLSKALRSYLKAHAGELPADISQLLSPFDPPIDPAILTRYETLASGDPSKMAPNEWIIAEKSLANEWDDMRLYLTASLALKNEPSANNFNEAIRQATWAFAKANERKPSSPAQLLPYLQDSDKKMYDLAMLQRFWSSPLRRDPLQNIPADAVIHIRQKPDGQMTADVIETPR